MRKNGELRKIAKAYLEKCNAFKDFRLQKSPGAVLRASGDF